MTGVGAEAGVDLSLSTLHHSPSPWSRGQGMAVVVGLTGGGVTGGGATGDGVTGGGATGQWLTADLPTVNLQEKTFIRTSVNFKTLVCASMQWCVRACIHSTAKYYIFKTVLFILRSHAASFP